MDKELLFKPRLTEEDVEIPGVGTVRVRALSRAEAMIVSDVKGTEARERKILAFGMVDPQMTEAEVGRWQKAATAGEVNAVALRIATISGLLDGAAKEAVKNFRGEPDA